MQVKGVVNLISRIEKMPAVNDTEGVDYSRMGFVPPTTLRGMWDLVCVQI